MEIWMKANGHYIASSSVVFIALLAFSVAQCISPTTRL